MHTALRILIFIALTGSGLAAEPPVSKVVAPRTLISVLTELEALAGRQAANYPTGEAAKQIGILVDRVTQTEQLAKLAIICDSITSPQSAGDAAYDGVFDYAMWECARRIAAKPGNEAAGELERLKPIIGPDAGDSLRMKELMAAQAKLPEKR